MTTNSKNAESIRLISEQLVELAVLTRKDSFHDAGIKIAKAAQLVAEASAEIAAYTLKYAEVTEDPKFDYVEDPEFDFNYGPDCEES